MSLTGKPVRGKRDFVFQENCMASFILFCRPPQAVIIIITNEVYSYMNLIQTDAKVFLSQDKKVCL